MTKKRIPDANLANSNLFLVIEQYLATFDSGLEQRIKQLSHEYRQEAFALAELKFPGKSIAADEWQPLLLDKIKQLADEAAPYSMRLMQNNQKVTPTDPLYIFKLGPAEQAKILAINSKLLEAKSKLKPDGLIFTYAGYIERYKSQFAYISNTEMQIYRNNSLLLLKASKLKEKGASAAAGVLEVAYSDIATLMKSYSTNETDCVSQVVAVLQEAQKNEELQTHSRVKKFITNFLIAISGIGLLVLAVSAKNRDSFWYHPETSGQALVRGFADGLEQKPGMSVAHGT